VTMTLSICACEEVEEYAQWYEQACSGVVITLSSEATTV
jgi:hypothetical protein